jgi:hypothetical protein
MLLTRSRNLVTLWVTRLLPEDFLLFVARLGIGRHILHVWPNQGRGV